MELSNERGGPSQDHVIGRLAPSVSQSSKIFPCTLLYLLLPIFLPVTGNQTAFFLPAILFVGYYALLEMLKKFKVSGRGRWLGSFPQLGLRLKRKMVS